MDPVEVEALVGENYYLTRKQSNLDKLSWKARNLKAFAKGYVISLERAFMGNRIKYNLEKVTKS